MTWFFIYLEICLKIKTHMQKNILVKKCMQHKYAMTHKFIEIIIRIYVYHNNLIIFFNFLINQFVLLCHIYVYVLHVYCLCFYCTKFIEFVNIIIMTWADMNFKWKKIYSEFGLINTINCMHLLWFLSFLWNSCKCSLKISD